MVLVELSHGQRHAGDAGVIDQQVRTLDGHQGHSVPEKSDQTHGKAPSVRKCLNPAR